MKPQMLYLVAGARPNFMKIAPIVRALRARTDDFTFKIIHTGQHYDADMSDVFFKQLDIPAPDHHLNVGGGSHAEQTAKIMVGFEQVCLQQKPDWVLVVGDVNSTLACAIVAKKLQLPLAHIEAGLRSGDRTMPEEINRLVTDAITDLFFVTEKSALEYLSKEGKDPSTVHSVGHVMIDNLLHQVDKINAQPELVDQSSALKKQLKDYAVVTLHRPSNVDDKQSLTAVVEILEECAKRLPIVFPIHPRTAANIKKFGLQLSENIHQLGPLPYLDFLNLFRDATFVLTDSGGLQEETTALGVPCLTMRDSTERPITVTEGCNILVPRELETVRENVDKIMNGHGKKGRIPDLWDGQAASRILDILHKLRSSKVNSSEA